MSNHPEFDAMFSGGQPDEQRESEQARNNPFLEIAQQAALARRNGIDPFAHFDLTAIEARLTALPTRPKTTLGATIERLAPVLLKLKDRGYSANDLVSELKAVGIIVSARGLARHLRAGTPKKRASSKQ